MSKNLTTTYLDETDLNISEDLLTRKEFALFKENVETSIFKSKLQEINDEKNIIPKFLIADNIPNSNYLEFRSYQLLTRNFLNPNTPYSRLLLKWETGHGKTIASLAIALNFIKYYQIQDTDVAEQIGSVYIVGFTQSIFKDELLRYPEFGFLSRDELNHLKELKKRSYLGNPNDIETLKKYLSGLRKRFYNRRNNGFFKFIGYKELANRLFLLNSDYNKESAMDITDMDETELKKYIALGKITVNELFLKDFANSLIICDEIHNVYNTFDKNNWGIALQLILNYHSSCRALFLSATPLNNSPTEIIDLLNLLLPRKHYRSLHKKDFFTNINESKYQDIKKSKEQELCNYMKGRISFIRDRNPKFIATKQMLGESIPGIEYIKFVRCAMSTFQYNTYKSALSDNVNSLGQDGQYVIDFALPDPALPDPYATNAIGLYKLNDIKEKLDSTTQAWKEKYKIQFNDQNITVTGALLQKETLERISDKYYTMVQAILQNITDKKGKTFIYHNLIHVSGTIFIQEILLQNNIIGEFDSANDNTICCMCGKKRKDHTSLQLNPLSIDNTYLLQKIQEDGGNGIGKNGKNGKKYGAEAHYYQPARFAIIHSNLDSSQIIRSREKFNHINNLDGSKILILIGSKIIKEGHSMNSVRNIFIMSRPDNISSLIQIMGRAIRLNSHRLLPINERNVDISIFVSSLPIIVRKLAIKNKENQLSYEESKYGDKIETFKIIQKIEKLMHENAIDAYFNYSTIWAKQEGDEFGLNILPFELKKTKHLNPDELNLSTFNAYHAKFEVHYFISIIKRLFIEISNVWRYGDLFNAVKYPPFNIEINTMLISEDIFNIALNTVLYNNSLEYVEPEITSLNNELIQTNLMDKIYDPNDKIIIIRDDIKYVITHIGELYTLAPIYHDEVFIDIDSTFRNIIKEKATYVDLVQYLRYESTGDYISKKIRFINKWQFTNLIDLEQSLCDFGTSFHVNLLEDIIEYVFKIYTEANIKKDEHHVFYLKMLYFYDLQKLVAWSHLIDDNLKDKYTKYTIPVVLSIHDKTDKTDKDNEFTKTSIGNLNSLITSYNRNKEWISTNMIKEYNYNIHESEKLFDNLYKKTNKIVKVKADLLPVGHYLKKISRFYNASTGWFDYKLVKNNNFRENDVIIGYDIRSKTGISIKFKLRNPQRNQKNKNDTRQIETGVVCSTKSKEELYRIAKRLNIVIDEKDKLSNSEDLCSKIRSRLIYLELKERSKPDGLKYFYNVLESYMQ